MKASLLKKIIKISKQPLLVPFYHKVIDDEDTFAKYLYKPRKIIDFKNDLDVLCKYYKSITLQEFTSISKKKSLKENYFHLTFDDGLSNFYKVVAPILLKKKVAATIFINTNFIDNKSLFFRYKASLLYQIYQKSSQKEKYKFYNFFNKKGLVKERLFAVNYINKGVLDDLATAINYSFEEYLDTEKPYLSSNQIQELIDMGFTIGAHSKTHPLYSLIPFEDQIKQTVESIDCLVGRFNLDYRAFSFPHTDLDVSLDFFQKLAKERKIDISFGSSGIKKDNFETNFQRINFETDNPDLENHLIKEYFKYFLKIPLLKNVMPRK